MTPASTMQGTSAADHGVCFVAAAAAAAAVELATHRVGDAWFSHVRDLSC